MSSIKKLISSPKKSSLIGGHKKDMKHDTKPIQDSEDTSLEAQTKAVIGAFKDGAISADGLNQVMILLTCWITITVGSISRCNDDIVNGSRGKEIKKKLSTVSDLADEYIINSKKMLDLLGELDKFLKSARFYLSYTENVVQEYFEKKETADGNNIVTIDDEHYVKISKKLRYVMDSHRSSSASDKSATMLLLEKIQDLISLADKKRMENLKVKNNHEDVVDRVGDEDSRYALKELGEIKSLVNEFVNEIESRSFHAINEGQLDLTMKNIKNKLGPLLKIIEDLEVEATKCSSKIMETRDEIINSASDH